MSTVLAEIEKVIGFISDHQGGVTFKSVKVTYPKGVGPNTTTLNKQVVFVLMHSNVVTADDDIRFSLQGNFGFENLSDGTTDTTKPVMANLFITLEHNSDVFGTVVDFNVDVGDSAVGTSDAPRLQFFISGTFSSVGGGSCTYKATLEVDSEAGVTAIDTGIVSGSATIDPPGTIGVVHVTL